MSRNEEITIVFRGERYRFANADGDVCIGVATVADQEGEITIKGPWDVDELRTQQSYRLYGHWTEYRNQRTGKSERQFHFSTFVQAEPAGREGVISYLRYAGDGNGIGTARAVKLWELYGSDAVRVLREDPERVATAIKGLDLEKAKSASAWLQKEKKVEAATIELTNLLAGKGFPRATARAAIKEWGNRAALVVRRDPYSLMNFRGCGFKRCDNLWLELGLPANRLRRQALCAWYAVASDSEGHTWYPVDFAISKLAGLVGTTELRPGSALKLAKRIGQRDLDRNGALCFLRTDSTGVLVSEGGSVWVAEGRKAWCEQVLADKVVDSYSEIVTWPDVSAIEEITDHQREQLRSATGGTLGILGGGPGTGKTYTAARMIAVLAEQFGVDQIAVGAPTGKAAVRITEAMNAYGLSLRARTWHSLLGIGKSSGDSGNWGFAHNESDPLEFRVLVGDESSMLDTNLMASILRARAPGTLLLLIGDVHQLPPVGHGAPLRDLIAAGVPYGELSEIKRNSGGIVEACAAIRTGTRWQPGTNLVGIESSSPEQQIESLIATIKSASAHGLDPIWDVQPVVAVNAKSPLARKAVNEVLQRELNPASRNRPRGQPFAVGDKVVNLKNGFFKPLDSLASLNDEDGDTNDQGDVFVANGELAEVIEVADKHFTARLQSPLRVIRIPRGKAQDGQDGGDGENSDKSTTGCSWDLGFALSVHKSQGSEWPWVIVLVDEYPGARMICTREFWYTAISRAKRQCFLIGKKSVIDAGCRKVAIGKRKTFLKELIHQRTAARILAEI